MGCRLASSKRRFSTGDPVIKLWRLAAENIILRPLAARCNQVARGCCPGLSVEAAFMPAIWRSHPGGIAATNGKTGPCCKEWAIECKAVRAVKPGGDRTSVEISAEYYSSTRNFRQKKKVFDPGEILKGCDSLVLGKQCAGSDLGARPAGRKGHWKCCPGLDNGVKIRFRRTDKAD